MKNKFSLFALLVLFTFSVCTIRAQQPSNEISNPQTDEQYRIMSEDLLDVRFFNRTHGDYQVRVGCSGIIILPLVDEINVLSKTVEEVKSELETKYSKYLKNPGISVSLKKSHKDDPVKIIGAVNKPLSFQLKTNIRLIEALNLAGGFADKAGELIQITRSACVTSANKDKNPLIYKKFDVISGDEKSNPYILPGDTITVLESEPVYVVGSVCFPQTLYFYEGLTLTKAIAMVGGVVNDSNLEKIRIIRQSNNNTKTVLSIDVKAISNGKLEDIALQPQDIIDVPCKKCKQTIPCPSFQERKVFR